MLDMAQELIFPPEGNFSNIPENFRCSDIHNLYDNYILLKELNVHSIFMVDSPAGWSVNRTADFNEAEHIDFFFIISGSVCFKSAGNSGRAECGQVLIIPSWISRVIYTDSQSNHIYIRINCNREKFSITDIRVHDSAGIDDITAFVRSLMSPGSPAAFNPLYRKNLLENISFLVSQELLSGKNRVSSEKAVKVQEYLRKEAPDKLNVHRVAKKFSMSLSSFRQFCLKNFQKSPNELLNDIRMSQARALLLYSDLTIDAIAAQLGYSSRFAFSKAFRRMNNLSPVLFRRSGKL